MCRDGGRERNNGGFVCGGGSGGTGKSRGADAADDAAGAADDAFGASFLVPGPPVLGSSVGVSAPSLLEGLFLLRSSALVYARCSLAMFVYSI